jgi:putative radical SAM enzyme (TIGR03279 family)
MPLKIEEIQPNSLAVRTGLKSGDVILTINDHEINDFLDLQYHSSDDVLQISLQTEDNKKRLIYLEQDWQTPLGIEPAAHKCRTCANDCIFCFVDQMRPDFRETLYIKDDDYRLSFVYGNFITLTNLSNKDFERIIEQKLSPLYISVHTTNHVLHKKMLRYKHDFDIQKRLIELSNSGIELHTQIVIVPGWNDGTELTNTLNDLTSPSIEALSVGIVPVGLTKFRKSLNSIQPLNKTQAQQLLEASQDYPHTYCSDEIYLLADQPVPPEEFYDEYPQLENGIGMIRLLWKNWHRNKNKFIKKIKKLPRNLVLITGVLAAPEIQKISNEINNSLPAKTRIAAVKNDFFGDTVTVTGLLSANDIFSQVQLLPNEIPVLCNCIFNEDGLTLDNIDLDGFRNNFNETIMLIDEEFTEWQFL